MDVDTAPMTDTVSLRDELEAVGIDEILSQLDGELIVWTREINGKPAQATFTFQTEAQYDAFRTAVLKVPGASCGTPLINTNKAVRYATRNTQTLRRLPPR